MFKMTGIQIKVLTYDGDVSYSSVQLQLRTVSLGISQYKDCLTGYMWLLTTILDLGFKCLKSTMLRTHHKTYKWVIKVCSKLSLGVKIFYPLFFYQLQISWG